MGKAELRLDIDPDLLAEARAAGVALGPAVEAGLRLALRSQSGAGGAEERARRWAEENAEAIAIHNQRVSERGIFGEDLRRW